MNDQTDTAKHLLEHVSKFAIEQFDDAGSFTTMWFIVDGDGKMVPVVSPMLNSGDAPSLRLLIKNMLKEYHALRYAMVSEAWMVRSGDDATINVHTVASEHPKRREVITIAIEDHNGQYIFAMHDILRKDGEKPTLGPLQIMSEVTHTEGSFASMFERMVH